MNQKKKKNLALVFFNGQVARGIIQRPLSEGKPKTESVT